MGDSGWFGEAIGGLHAAIDDLGEPSLAATDAEVRQQVLDLGVVVARLEARRLAWLRALDARPEAVPGAASGAVAATFLIHAGRTARFAAHHDVRSAAMIGEDGLLPGLGAALAAGEVSRAHVDVAVRAIRQLPRRLLGRVGDDGRTVAQEADAFLVEYCRRFPPDDVRILLRHLLAVLDPDGHDRHDPDAFQRREFHAGPDFSGMLTGSFSLDPEGGATLKAAIDHYAAPNPTTEGLDQDGNPVPIRDTRTRAQRQADALVQIADLALAAAHSPTQPGGRMPPQITVTATTAQLASITGPLLTTPLPGLPGHAGEAGPAGHAGEAGHPGLATCDQLGPITTPVLARLACDGVLRRVLLGPSGAVLDVGRAHRSATPGQRRALAARDGGCLIPGCRVPVALCDAHHVIFWSHGGPTDLSNLAALCPRHHTAVHAGVWRVEVRGDLPYVIPPHWIDPNRRAVRNTLPAAVQTAIRLGQHLHAAGEHPGIQGQPHELEPP